MGIQKSKEKEAEKNKKRIGTTKSNKELPSKEITMLIREDRERWFSI